MDYRECSAGRQKDRRRNDCGRHEEDQTNGDGIDGCNVFSCTYEAGFAGVDKRLCREPLPHERACRTIVHGVEEAADVVVHCTRYGHVRSHRDIISEVMILLL